MPFCGNCGQRVDTQPCPHCGWSDPAQAGPAAYPSAAQPTLPAGGASRWLWGLVALATLALLAGLGWWLLTRGDEKPSQAQVTQTVTVPPATAASDTPPPSTDPLRPPLATPSARPQTPSGADGCPPVTTTDGAYGLYLPADCRFWHESTGLVHGGTLSKDSPHLVACQADLGRANPVFTAGQTNTWWVWVASDDGMWDWHPLTAVSQGESDSPVPGVSLCEP
ncbi:MAG: hypothetical protein LWW86_12920 [Micrococcales bacterium]|nr:hypothetical protein [Micrococcales bacterium]